MSVSREASDVQNDLCRICSSVDIRYLLTAPASDECVDIGAYRDLQSRSVKCPLCHVFITALRKGPLGLKSRLRLDDEFVLAPKATGVHHLQGGQDAAAPIRAFRLQVLTDDFESAGDVLLDADDARLVGQSPLFHGRKLGRLIDTEKVKRWIAECRRSHELCESGSRVRDFEISLPEQSLLIDVNAQCIVDASPGCQYAALSYTWGAAKQYLTTEARLPSLRKEGSLSMSPLPSTVRDAVTLTRDVGLKYLWVDCLCIIQDSKTHKAKQISRMHNVYGGAVFTIVAASGADADDGLPGVRRPRETEQDVATVDGLRLIARHCFLDVTMNRSAYNKRAWTYQEACLSRRMLYVTSTGATFHCCQGIRSEEFVLEDDGCADERHESHMAYLDSTQRNLWREFITQEKTRDGSDDCSCSFDYRRRFLDRRMPLRPFGEERDINGPITQQNLACSACLEFHRRNETEFHIYKELVRAYTRRNMRFESDRLPAFAGIAGLLEQAFATNFFFGLPEKYLEMALIWTSRENRVERCRRVGLEKTPSWSWASHEIHAEYTGDVWLTSEVDWYCVDETDTLRPVKSLKVIGTHAPLRDDFFRPVTIDQLSSLSMLTRAESHTAALFGWCQIATSFYLKDARLYDEDKQAFDPEWNTVHFSDVCPYESLNFIPVELCCISRSFHAGIDRRSTNPRSYEGDWELQDHMVNLLLIERQGNVARRLAIAAIRNVAVWKRVRKEWQILKLV